MGGTIPPLTPGPRTTTTGAPSPRSLHTGIWTGSEWSSGEGTMWRILTMPPEIYYPNTAPIASFVLTSSHLGDATFTLGLQPPRHSRWTPPPQPLVQSVHHDSNEDKLGQHHILRVGCERRQCLPDACNTATSGFDLGGKTLSGLSDSDSGRAWNCLPGNHTVWLRVFTDEVGVKRCFSANLNIQTD